MTTKSKDFHAFQFHCMICFEEFENSLRYPVVLPCGHTFVCKVCGDKLDKCMECREPLFMTFVPDEQQTPNSPSYSAPQSAPHHHQTAASRSSWASARSGAISTPQYRGIANSRGAYTTPARQHHEPPKKPFKKRLPLPKNVVLLSLIDTTKLIAGDSGASTSQSTIDNAPALSEEEPLPSGLTAKSSEEEEVDEEEENDRAQLAASVSAGVAGTYSVTVQDRLRIHPSRPNSELSRSNSGGSDDDVDSLVQVFQADKVLKDILDGDGSAEMATLAFGDRFQVVNVDNGWAKLARGYGYVRSDNNQIAKVGNALDRACILEAMLRQLGGRRKELRQRQSENDVQFVKLLNQLQGALQNDEDLTVICRTAFATEEENEEKDLPNSDSLTEKKDDGDNPAIHDTKAHAAFADTTLAPLQPNVRMTQQPTYSPNLFSSNNRASSPSPSEMRKGALAWRERQVREVQKSINFRSGLSGHMALASNRAHPHDFLSGSGSSGAVSGSDSPSWSPARARSSNNLRVTNFRMSSHMGLSRLRGTPSRRNQREQGINLTGSM